MTGRPIEVLLLCVATIAKLNPIGEFSKHVFFRTTPIAPKIVKEVYGSLRKVVVCSGIVIVIRK